MFSGFSLLSLASSSGVFLVCISYCIFLRYRFISTVLPEIFLTFSCRSRRPAVSISFTAVIISVLNGISSEEMIAEKYGDKNLVYCVALGMDAMREGTDLVFSGKGKEQNSKMHNI